jgi:small subunit ribosomal protein S4
MHPNKGRISNYGKQFREKQKVKRIYGLLEAQFRRFFAMATKDKMQTGTKLLQLLERRLDNVIHRMGVTESRNQARQLVNHGHVLVNGKKVDVPSFLVGIGDEIELKFDRISPEFLKEMQTLAKGVKPSTWIEVSSYGKGKIVSLPERSMIDQSISEQLIVEYYSR